MRRSDALGADTVLPALPDRWGETTNGFRMCWRNGAFGDRTSIEDVFAFRVLEDEWLEVGTGDICRTIIRAEITELFEA